MVVQPLRRQHLGQVALLPRGLLQLGPLVLEPDLNLRLVEPQVGGQRLPALLVEVAVLFELPPEPGQLVGGEGGARALLLRRPGRVGGLLALLDLARAGSWRGKKRKSRN